MSETAPTRPGAQVEAGSPAPRSGNDWQVEISNALARRMDHTTECALIGVDWRDPEYVIERCTCTCAELVREWAALQ